MITGWKPTFIFTIAEKINGLKAGLELKTVSAKGLKLWPSDQDFEILNDHWACRFMKGDGEVITHLAITELLHSLAKAGIDFIKTENLYNFGESRGYSLAQGE